ncbi:F0F1 ATP synthase subunit A [Butyrivibrio sp. NC2002]|uniref:F0F1 ATP synthase subunit A n=1 Tax=Butyrivibrio sp. NC2002 TaxID=1410610 RepID=UPI0005634967|nr:F0F1 ATP synthase subunit A [Butyrivibrio sp. NC2002]
MNFEITGSKIFYTIHTPIPVLGDFQITETLIVSWIVMVIITLLCIFLTRNLQVENISKRQAIAEMLVETANNFVRGNTGSTKFDKLIPLVATIFTTSVVSNLICLVGLRSPTADLATEAAWAVVVFVIITATKIKAGGIGGYLKGFTQPIPVLTPFNILSEFATPVSMACRHFGNILSGVVIDGLIYAALALASSAILGLIPGTVGAVLSQIPILSVGIPAVLGVYFDWFTGVMQAFIFSMLTIMYIANAAEG